MSPLEIAQTINAEDEKVAQAVKQVLPNIAIAIEKIAASLRTVVGSSMQEQVLLVALEHWMPRNVLQHLICRLTWLLPVWQEATGIRQGT